MSVHRLPVKFNPPNHGGGSEPPMDITGKVELLEKNVTEAKIDIAVIKSNYATKADVSDAKNSIIMWVVTSIFIAQLIPSLIKFIQN